VTSSSKKATQTDRGIEMGEEHTGQPIGDPIPVTGPPPSGTNLLPAQEVKDTRLDKLGLYVAGIIVSLVIAAVGWVFGGLYERLDKAEDRIQTMEKLDVEHKNKIEQLEGQTQRQWALISANKQDVGELKVKVDAYHR